MPKSKLKFDKSLYYINLFNSNYRLRSQSSIDHTPETVSNFYNNNVNNTSILHNNIYHNYIGSINNNNNVRLSMESIEESQRNKSQLTFVCNNENITESDKQLDLQYYLLQGNKNLCHTLQLDSPSRKNYNLPLSMNNCNSLTTPKFPIGSGKHAAHIITSPDSKYSKFENIQNKNYGNYNTISSSSNIYKQNNLQTNLKLTHPNLSYSNTVNLFSPMNNFATIAYQISESISNLKDKNSSNHNDNVTNANINKNNKKNTNNIATSNINSNIFNNNFNTITSKNNSINQKHKFAIKKSETERNVLSPRQRTIKNKKETNYINININIKEDIKSNFKKIADLFDNGEKFYFNNYLNKESSSDINKQESYRSSSLKNNNTRNCFAATTRNNKKNIINTNDYLIEKNLPFSGNFTTRKKYSEATNLIISHPLRLKKNKSNSISNYYELNNKYIYNNESTKNFNMNYLKAWHSSDSKKKSDYNLSLQNYGGNLEKHTKNFPQSKYGAAIFEEKEYREFSNNFKIFNGKKNNYADAKNYYNTNFNTITPMNSVSNSNVLTVNDIKSNLTKRFSNTIKTSNISSLKLLKEMNLNKNSDSRPFLKIFSNTHKIHHTYNPSLNSINNSTINCPYSKNHIMIFTSIVNEKINKLKRFFFMKLVLYCENADKTNKKYAIRLIFKILKRRIICHKLNFFTRSNQL